MPVTFPVSHVTYDDSDYSPYLPRYRKSTTEVMAKVLGVTPEAQAINADYAVDSGCNGLVSAILRAFNMHAPLILSPDDVWLTLIQGFAQHVTVHAEELRSLFVAHEGQKDLFVDFDRLGLVFEKGSPDNQWPRVFGAFSTLISEHIGDEKRRLIVSDFSTTSPLEKTVSELVLMDAMKAYFTYSGGTMCGIPEITLLGVVDDWVSIRDRFQVFAEYTGMASWVTSATSVLDQFVEAFRGSTSPKFWVSFFNVDSGSGGPYISGHINKLFPYLNSRARQRTTSTSTLVENPIALGKSGRVHLKDYPKGISSVPFTWVVNGAPMYKMTFSGGFFGSYQDEATKAIRPVQGWAVSDEESGK